jgi:hypothetical protein
MPSTRHQAASAAIVKLRQEQQKLIKVAAELDAQVHHSLVIQISDLEHQIFGLEQMSTPPRNK